MTTNTKCGYCGVRGHTIGNCNSIEGNRLCTVIKSRALDYFTSHRDWSINSRAIQFYEHLKNRNYIVKELRFILSKMGCSTNGTKQELAARIVHQHFFLRLALRELSHLVSYEDRVNMEEYVKYWWHISIGVSQEESNRHLNEYFDWIDEMDFQEFDNNNDDSITKFPIQVSMEPVELTDENEKPPTFECAICMEDECSILDKVDIDCKHSFCKQCISQVMVDSQAKRKHPCCALCRGNFKTISVRRYHVLEDFKERFCM